MKSDIIVEGHHASIIKKLIDKGFFENRTQVFFTAAMTGILFEKQSEPSDGDDRVEITRTWINRPNNSNFRGLITTFLNLQSKMLGEPLKLQDIFLDEEQTNSSDKIVSLKNYAYFGLEHFEREYLIDNLINDDMDLMNTLESELLNEAELTNEFSKIELTKTEDPDIKEILGE